MKKRNFIACEHNSSLINNNEFYKYYRTVPSMMNIYAWKKNWNIRDLAFAWKLWKSCSKSQPQSLRLCIPRRREISLREVQDNIWISWIRVKSFLIPAIATCRSWSRVTTRALERDSLDPSYHDGSSYRVTMWSLITN